MISTEDTTIIFTTDTIHRGGKERQLFVLTRGLLDKGFKIGIITKNYSKENYLLEYGLEQHIVKIYQGNNIIEKFRSFQKIILSENPRYIISWDFQTSLYSLVLNKNNNFKFINASIQHGIRLLKLSHYFRTLVCFLSPYVIANSFAGLRANNLRPGERRFVLYNGIENKFRNNLSRNETEQLKIQMIPGYSGKPGTVYISIANLVPYKDYFTVLKALNKLKNQQSFYYFIIGDGPNRGVISEIVKKQGLEERVFLIGRIDNVRDYLYISDILIHSSRGEGISNAILEGMFAGLPVIATNVGGIPETVFPGSSLLFPYKNDTDLLNNLLKAPDYFKKFDPNTEEYLSHLKKFSVERMLMRFEEILEIVENSKN